MSKRMVKKQQMRRSQKGTLLLLHVCTRILNGELRNEFQKWCPRFDHHKEELSLAA
ncbi:hypothetical protein DESC_790056 [Desulfosarcina cetonica]|nr:hypothetical protein DESC_790056 [Desulfosarcina cetonica]